jgi:hypothetical protein
LFFSKQFLSMIYYSVFFTNIETFFLLNFYQSDNNIIRVVVDFASGYATPLEMIKNS